MVQDDIAVTATAFHALSLPIQVAAPISAVLI